MTSNWIGEGLANVPLNEWNLQASVDWMAIASMRQSLAILDE